MLRLPLEKSDNVSAGIYKATEFIDLIVFSIIPPPWCHYRDLYLSNVCVCRAVVLFPL